MRGLTVICIALIALFSSTEGSSIRPTKRGSVDLSSSNDVIQIEIDEISHLLDEVDSALGQAMQASTRSDSGNIKQGLVEALMKIRRILNAEIQNLITFVADGQYNEKANCIPHLDCDLPPLTGDVTPLRSDVELAEYSFPTKIIGAIVKGLIKSVIPAVIQKFKSHNQDQN